MNAKIVRIFKVILKLLQFSYNFTSFLFILELFNNILQKSLLLNETSEVGDMIGIIDNAVEYCFREEAAASLHLGNAVFHFAGSDLDPFHVQFGVLQQ